MSAKDSHALDNLKDIIYHREKMIEQLEDRNYELTQGLQWMLDNVGWDFWYYGPDADSTPMVIIRPELIGHYGKIRPKREEQGE